MILKELLYFFFLTWRAIFVAVPHVIPKLCWYTHLPICALQPFCICKDQQNHTVSVVSSILPDICKNNMNLVEAIWKLTWIEKDRSGEHFVLPAKPELPCCFCWMSHSMQYGKSQNIYSLKINHFTPQRNISLWHIHKEHWEIKWIKQTKMQWDDSKGKWHSHDTALWVRCLQSSYSQSINEKKIIWFSSVGKSSRVF